MECFEQYWHGHWHQKPQQDWLWHRTPASSAGESCCSGGGGRCSRSPSRPTAPPPLPLRCRLGWRGFPPGCERSGSIRRCEGQPAGEESNRELRDRVGRPAIPLAQNRGTAFEASSSGNGCGCARWGSQAPAPPTRRGLVTLQSAADFPGQIWQLPLRYQLEGAFTAGGREKSCICLILRKSFVLQCCCKILPLVKIFQIFQTKARPWSLQVHTCMFNFAHVSWAFEVSEAVPKRNCLQDRGQRAQGNRAFTTLHWNYFPEVH